MTGRELTRRRALAPLAGLALVGVALGPAAAQPAQPLPPGTVRGLTTAQKNRLNAALRYLRAAKAQVAAANLSAANAARINGPIDTAIAGATTVLSGRVREPQG